MSVGVALILSDVTRLLLYKKVGEKDGKVATEDRELPFRLRYRLNKNLVFFNRVAESFNQRRLMALAKYGTMSEDGNNVVIEDDENKEKFKKEVSDLIDSEVSFNLNLLNPEDLDLVTDTDMTISPEAMSVFIRYMTDDESLNEEIEFKPKTNNTETKEETKDNG